MQLLSIALDDSKSVSALLCLPSDTRALFVFAHGAGAGMDHAFMTCFADGLADGGIGSLRYQFPSMEAGSRRPDPPAVATATVRKAVAEAAAIGRGLPLFAGGKSFGGRMTSQAQAAAPMPGVLGLAFIGFPLHAANKPGTERAEHLSRVACPMLFLQGTRDALAEIALIGPVVEGLGSRATLRRYHDADHAFHARKRSGSDDAEVRRTMVQDMAAWIDDVIALR